MAAGDLYLIRHQGSYFGENVENVYFYRHDVGSGDAALLATSFFAEVWPSLEDIVSVAYSSELLIVTNLDDVTDFVSQAAVGAGDRGGEGMPSFTAWGFTYFSTNRNIRSGGKRYGGISETDVDAGVATAAAIVLLDVLAGVLEDPFLDAGAVNSWSPRLNTPGNVATSGQQLDVPLAGVSYRRVTTQSTRKTL